MAEGPKRDTEERTRCICGGALEPAIVDTYRFQDDFGRQTVVHHVPAAVCARCGDVVVDPATVAIIGRRLQRAFYLPRHIDLAAD